MTKQYNWSSSMESRRAATQWRQDLETEHVKTRRGVNVALQAVARVVANQKIIIWALVGSVMGQVVLLVHVLGLFLGWW